MENNNIQKKAGSKAIQKNSKDIGLDPEEQAMNGLYGMVETKYEDSLHNYEETKNKQNK
jgi:hypothetical protein